MTTETATATAIDTVDISLDATTVKKMLPALAKFCSDNDSRPVLTTILIMAKPEENKVEFVSCDGWILGVVSLGIQTDSYLRVQEFASMFPNGFMLQDSDAKSIAKLIKIARYPQDPSITMRFDRTGTLTVLDSTGMAVTPPFNNEGSNGGQFPKYGALLPEVERDATDSHVHLNPALLAKVAILGSAIGCMQIRLGLGSKVEPLLVTGASSKYHGVSMTAVQMPMNMRKQ
jgi:hypothetical protein